MISQVTNETIDQIWPAFSAKIRRALKGSHYPESHYYDSVKSGSMQMWAAHENEVYAVGIVSVLEHKDHLSILVEVIAGERLNDWIEEVGPVLHKFKEITGATTIEAFCRPGLAKRLKGWKTKAILMEFQ